MERFNDQEENNQEMPDQGVSFNTSEDAEEDRPKGKEEGVYFSEGDGTEEHISKGGKDSDIPVIEIQTDIHADVDENAEEGFEEDDDVPFVSYNKTTTGSHLEDENFKREEVELDEDYVDEKISSYLDQKEESFDVGADLHSEAFIQKGEGVEISVEEPKIPNVDMALSEIPFSARKEKFGASWILWLKRKVSGKKRKGKEGFLADEILEGDVADGESSPESMAETASALAQEEVLEDAQSIPLSEPPNKKKKDIPRIVLYSSLAVASLFTLGWFVPVDGEETVKDKIVSIFADELEYVATKPAVTPPPPPLPQPTLDEVEKDMKNDPETKMIEKSKEIQKTLNRQFGKTSLIVEKVEFVGNVIKVQAKAPLTADYEANAAVIRLQKNLLPFLEGDLKNEISLQTAKGIYRYKTPTVVISFVSDLHMLDRHALEMWWRNSEIKRDGINLKSYYRQDRLYVKALKPIFETPEITVKKAENLKVQEGTKDLQTVSDAKENISFKIDKLFKKQIGENFKDDIFEEQVWYRTDKNVARLSLIAMTPYDSENIEDELIDTLKKWKPVLKGSNLEDYDYYLKNSKNILGVGVLDVKKYGKKGSVSISIFDINGIIYTLILETSEKSSTELAKIVQTIEKKVKKKGKSDDGESPITGTSQQSEPQIQSVTTPKYKILDKSNEKAQFFFDSQEIFSIPLPLDFKQMKSSETNSTKLDAFMNDSSLVTIEVSKKKRSLDAKQEKDFKAKVEKKTVTEYGESLGEVFKKTKTESQASAGDLFNKTEYFSVVTYMSKRYKLQIATTTYKGKEIVLVGLTFEKEDLSFDEAIKGLSFEDHEKNETMMIDVKKIESNDIKETLVDVQLAFDQNRSYDKSNNQTKGLIAGYHAKTKKNVVFEVLDTKKLFASYEVAINKKSILNEGISKATDTNKNGYLEEAAKRAVKGKAIYVLEKKSNTVFALVYRNKRLETF